MTDLRTYLPEDAARRETARAFDDACEASGLSNEQIGVFLGCAETYVGRMRRGEKPIPAHREVQLPASIARPFAAALAAAQERHHAPLVGNDLDAQVAALGATALALANEIITAFGSEYQPGRKIDPNELAKILGRYLDVDRQGHRLRVVAGGAR